MGLTVIVDDADRLARDSVQFYLCTGLVDRDFCDSGETKGYANQTLVIRKMTWFHWVIC